MTTEPRSSSTPQSSEPAAFDAMKEIFSLSKQRGFVFQSSEIDGELKSWYDYGPLGVEFKWTESPRPQEFPCARENPHA
jgi:hypothetical protein